MNTTRTRASAPRAALRGDRRRLALATLCAADPPLARVIERVGEFRLTTPADPVPFEWLLRAVAHQQLNAKAANAILARVHAAAAVEGCPTPAALLEVPESTLRATGLSAAKVATVRDLAAKTVDGTVPDLRTLRRLSDDAIVERLTSVRGIGRWTVEMLLIFGLGRPDVLPATDYGIQQGFARAFRRPALPAPREILLRGERWRPFRTVASWYLWRLLELPRRGSTRRRS